jgi:hypothetical protein
MGGMAGTDGQANSEFVKPVAPAQIASSKDVGPIVPSVLKLQAGPDGKMLYVDDNRLRQDTIRRSTKQHDLKVVNEGAPASKKSAGKKEKKDKNARWSMYETDKFYDCLRMFGTDFTLIAHRFKNRTRKQIKAKYQQEEKKNPTALTWALNHEYLNQLPSEVDPFELAMPCEYRGYDLGFIEDYWSELRAQLCKCDVPSLWSPIFLYFFS